MLSEAAPKENGFILSHNTYYKWYNFTLISKLKKYFGDNIQFFLFETIFFFQYSLWEALFTFGHKTTTTK